MTDGIPDSGVGVIYSSDMVLVGLSVLVGISVLVGSLVGVAVLVNVSVGMTVGVRTACVGAAPADCVGWYICISYSVLFTLTIYVQDANKGIASVTANVISHLFTLIFRLSQGLY